MTTDFDKYHFIEKRGYAYLKHKNRIIAKMKIERNRVLAAYKPLFGLFFEHKDLKSATKESIINYEKQ